MGMMKGSHRLAWLVWMVIVVGLLIIEVDAGHKDKGGDETATADTTDGDTGTLSTKDEYLTEAQQVLSRFETVFIALMIPIGLTGSIFGILLFKPFLVIAGLIAGGSISYVWMVKVTTDTAVASWLPIVFGIFAAILSGFIAFKLALVGVFAIGSSLGVAIAFLLWTTKFYVNASPDNPLKVFKITASVLGVATGVASLFFQRFLIIVSMAYSGSFATVYGVGHLCGRFPDLQQLGQEEVFKSTWPWIWFLWFIVQASVGMYIQFRIMDRSGVESSEAVGKQEEDGSNSFYFSGGGDGEADNNSSISGANEWSNTWDDEDDDDIEVGPVIDSQPARPLPQRKVAGRSTEKAD